LQVAEHAMTGADSNGAEPDELRQGAAAPISPRAWSQGPKPAAATAEAPTQDPSPDDAPDTGAADQAPKSAAGPAKAAAAAAAAAAAQQLPASKDGKVLHPDLVNPNIIKTQ
jgi:hypothetical protein